MSTKVKSAGETASAASNAPANVSPGHHQAPPPAGAPGRSVPPVDADASSHGSVASSCVREALLDHIFNSIAELADMLGVLGAKLVDAVEGEGADEALIVRHLADKVGWMADHGSALVGGYQLRGGAAQWMLPPAFHSTVSELFPKGASHG
jgi:hypothetical protein